MAVGSRNTDRGAAFAERWSLARPHDSYEALLDDPDVDIVYVAAAASRANRFVGEAMCTKFLPKFDVIEQLLDDGALGEIRTVAGGERA